jgi:uncharacterized membrane protein
MLRSRKFAFACAAGGAALALALPSSMDAVTRALVSWDAAVGVYLAVVAYLMARSGVEDLKKHAAEYDEGRALVLTITLIAAAMSLAAIVLKLAAAREGGGYHALDIALTALTIALSWTLVHLMFALHYAHEYYDPDNHEAPRGLKFPSEEEPTYGDFLHFAFVIGCANQTADISIPSPDLRRVITVHCVAAFVFNTAIVALTINMAAGIVGGK